MAVAPLHFSAGRVKAMAMLFRAPTAALILSFMLAGCGSGAGGGATAGGLTGLYEGGSGPRRSQLCLIEREGVSPSFGLIAWGSGDANCSASGTVRVEGDRLRLLPDNDESCAMAARVEGGRVSLTGVLSPECARYHCGGDARLDGAAFERVGDSADDAARAVDVAGDRLCAG